MRAQGIHTYYNCMYTYICISDCFASGPARVSVDFRWLLMIPFNIYTSCDIERDAWAIKSTSEELNLHWKPTLPSVCPRMFVLYSETFTKK